MGTTMNTMSEEGTHGEETQHDALQFDRAVAAAGAAPAASTAAPTEKPTVACAACRAAIDTEYFDVNGKAVCRRCRSLVESAAETPRGMVPLFTAAAYGLGAGIAGAIVYYAVIAIANLEIGIVAILIGYMVGYAVRKGAGGRGGLRFQVLAVCLTYGSIALAYTPLAIKGATAARSAKSASGTTANAAGNADEDTRARPDSRGFALGLVVLAGFVAALPILVIVGSLPSGLISALIIFIGMRQAWRMTGAPSLLILGPYRVGAAAAPRPA